MKNKAFQCAKCGACTSVCPVYQVTGRESLTARGRLHLLAESAEPVKSRVLADIFSKCLLCGACYDSCPRGLNVPLEIIRARRNIPEATGLPSFKKFLIRQILARPPLLEIAARTAKPLGIIPSDSGLHLKMPGLKRGQPASPQPLRPARSTSPPNVLYFTGCLATHFYPAIGQDSIRLLEKLCEMRPDIPSPQNCCGMAALAAGDRQQAKRLAINNIRLFSNKKTRELPIFTSCATCYSQLRSYPALLADEPEWSEEAEGFAGRVWEFASFLLKFGQNLPAKLQVPIKAPVVYHDPCHLRFQHKITNAPREIINMIPAAELRELPGGPQCCGQGGLFHLSHPDLSRKICDRLVEDFQRTQATISTTTCSGCLTQWQQALHSRPEQATAIHLAQLITAALFPSLLAKNS